MHCFRWTVLYTCNNNIYSGPKHRDSKIESPLFAVISKISGQQNNSTRRTNQFWTHSTKTGMYRRPLTAHERTKGHGWGTAVREYILCCTAVQRAITINHRLEGTRYIPCNISSYGQRLVGGVRLTDYRTKPKINKISVQIVGYNECFLFSYSLVFIVHLYYTGVV